MNEPGAQPTKTPHTWRPIALWSAAILLALGLAWFFGAVVVPVWQTRSAVERCAWYPRARGRGPNPIPAELDHLGGSEEVARRLSLYLRLPGWLAPNRVAAIWMLSECGASGIRRQVAFLGDEDRAVREAAAWTFGRHVDPESVRALIEVLASGGENARRLAALALGDLKAEAAVGPLEAALKDRSEEVRQAAAEALKKISGEAPLK